MNPYPKSVVRPHWLGLVLLSALSAPLSAATPIAESVAPLDARGTFEASNVRGRISVTTWDRNEVGWSGSLGAGAKLVVEKSPTRVALRVEQEGGSSWIDWGADAREDSVLVVKVPASASLELSSVSARIDVTAMRDAAAAEIESVSGNIVLKASTLGKLDVSSVSGDVEFEGQAAQVDVETVSGDIRLSGVSGEVSVESVSGTARVVAAVVEEFDGSSVSGDIEFDGSVAENAHLEFESMSGDIKIVLPQDANARISASSSSGDIEDDFDLSVEKAGRSGSTLRGNAGTGAARIDAETFSGDVSVRRR